MEDQPRSTLRRPSRAPGIIFVLLALAAGVGVGFWLRGRSGEPERAAPSAVVAAPDGGEAEGPVATVDPAKARSLLEAVSSNPLFRSWTGEGDLVRRWVVVTDNLAVAANNFDRFTISAPADARLPNGGSYPIPGPLYNVNPANASAVGRYSATSATGSPCRSSQLTRCMYAATSGIAIEYHGL